MAASVGAGLVGEYLIRRQADGQRASLARGLSPILQRSLAHAAGTVQRRLQAQYDAFLAETRREEEVWSAIRKEALEGAAQALPAGEERLAASFGLIERLRSQIHGNAEEG
jgi:inorganic triphosphatase YgiF